ncbi:MAG TPA: cation-transporting P-type ATPase, partial [Casimicrobium sp.]|nr:cation-transporting P-type ATPase [Casimicrobium sp.]
MPQPGIPENAMGLTSSEAARLLVEQGANALPNGNKRTLLKIVGETLREPMFLLLLAAGTLYLVFGDITEGLTLFGAVLATLGLTLYQEGKTERAIESLRDLTSPQARVIRDGTTKKISGRDVVAGDVLLLAEGDRVAADAFVLSADNLQADESLLT